MLHGRWAFENSQASSVIAGELCRKRWGSYTNAASQVTMEKKWIGRRFLSPSFGSNQRTLLQKEIQVKMVHVSENREDDGSNFSSSLENVNIDSSGKRHNREFDALKRSVICETARGSHWPTFGDDTTAQSFSSLQLNFVDRRLFRWGNPESLLNVQRSTGCHQ